MQKKVDRIIKEHIDTSDLKLEDGILMSRKDRFVRNVKVNLDSNKISNGYKLNNQFKMNIGIEEITRVEEKA